MKKIIIVFLVSSFLFSGCYYRPNAVEISGSSTVYPITLEAQSKYLDEVDSGLIASVEQVGTGGGFELFTKGDASINDASRAIKEEEIEQAQKNNIEYTEYKIGVDGITVIINPKNDFVKGLTQQELKKAFELGSQVEYWDDINSEYPHEKVNFYGPTSSSGTYDFFVETIIGDDKGALRDDMNATENDNEIVTNIQKDEYGIGFLGYSYYKSNEDKVAEVAINGIYPEEKSIKSGNYILSRPLFIYVNDQHMKENEDLNSFVTYYIHNSQEFVSLSGYVPLTDEEQKELNEKLNASKYE